ncbi:MAG: hypothetical protein AB2L07_08915 [Thermoanaerobaculaceae bacterium]
MAGARIDLKAAPEGLEELLAGFPAFVRVEGRLSWTWHDSTFGSVSIEVSESGGSLTSIVVSTDSQSHLARERANKMALRVLEWYAGIASLTWTA